MNIPSKDIKKLYAKSAGQCNMCRLNIVEENVQIGEIAHIIAKNKSGPRGNFRDRNNINHYDNLILLCPTCHTRIDKNHENYSIHSLLKMKREHEEYITNNINTDKRYTEDLTSLKFLMRYMPFSQLLGILEDLPYSINIEYSTPLDVYDSFIKDNPHVYPFNDNKLTQKFDMFIDYLYGLHNILSGHTGIDKNGQCKLITVNMFLNNYADNFARCYQNYSTADLNNVIHKNISLEFLDNQIVNSKKRLLESYFDLMKYLRSNYSSLEINSYVPYKFSSGTI